MAVFEIVIALLLGGAILAAIARRVSLPYPALVAIAGAALALFPRVPALVLDPELALALFVAPVLLDSAFDASQRDLRKNWRTVAGLAIGAVVLTVVFVAVVAHALVPGLPWTAAIALGDSKHRGPHLRFLTIRKPLKEHHLASPLMPLVTG
ncbi:MAG TPA: cation:proton antiporter [Thermoanaerobaculia bacterium]